jgi:D-alanyl-D-alanine carboxypeptidase
MRNGLRKKRAQQKILRTAVYGFVLLWTLCGLIGLFSVVQWTVGKVTGKQDQAYGKSLGEAEFGEETDTEALTEAGRDTAIAEPETEADPLLVLVNKEVALGEDYDADLRSICNGRLKASGALYEDLCAMLSDAGNAGYEYWIASAYRSRERQQELVDEDVEALMQKGYSYEDALAETYRETMPAGHSEHETGLALDILCSGNTDMDVSQADEPGNKWLLEHCSEYGFILRYPAAKEAVTGIAYEPWHFRYVGKEAAQYIMERGMVLEEYVSSGT